MSKNEALIPIEEVRGTLQKMAPQFKAALPANVSVEKFVRVVQTAIASNTDLLKCDRISLYSSAMKCAQDGLLPDGREAAIVKYGQAARYMPMVGGIAKKLRNSGELKTLMAEVVYEFDEYDHWSDENGEHFKHRKASGDRGRNAWTYAYAIMKDGGFYFEEIDEIDMKAIEACSQAKGGPWSGPFKDEMRKKSAIRRLAKHRLPISSDLEAMLRADDDMYEMSPAPAAPAQSEPVNVTPPASPQTAPRRRSRALQNVVDQTQKQDPPTEPVTTQAPPAAAEPPKAAVPTDII